MKLVKTEEARVYQVSPTEVAQAFGISLIDGESVSLSLGGNREGQSILTIHAHSVTEY